MPRAGWLAVGGLAAALGAGPLGLPWPALGLLVAAAEAGLVAVWAASPAGRRGPPAAIAVGAGLVIVRAWLGAAGAPLELPTVAPTATLTWTATVESISAPGGGDQRAVVLASAVDDEGAPGDASPAGGGQSALTAGDSSQVPGAASRYRLWVRLPRYPPVAPGDRISFRGNVEAVPAGEGFADYLRRLGAAGTVRAASLSLLPATAGPAAWLEHLRRAIDGWIAAVLPEPQAGLTTAIVIGLRDRVDRDVAAAFTSAGLSHVVAISGWNIALVAATVAALLGRARRRRRALVTALAVACYTLLAGASPSVLRAALMAGTALLARESGRPGRASATLGLACQGMLLLDPSVVGDAGFQLSVAATAGLITWGSRLTNALQVHLPAAVPTSLCEALGISLAAQAATLPIVVLQFARLSLVSPLANLAAAPVVAPVMLAGVLAALTGAALAVGLPAILSVPITVLGSLLVGLLVAIAAAAAAVPFASLTLPPPCPALVAAAAAAGLAIAGSGPRLRLRLPRLRRPAGTQRRLTLTAHTPHPPGPVTALAVALICLAALPLGLSLSARPDGRLHVAVLDVGQGDAILLTGDRGSRMLVDTGPDPDRLLRLLDAHLPAWDRHLALLLITHPHEDHVGGAALLLQRYRVDAVAEPGMRGAGPGDAAFRAELRATGLPERILARGDRITLDDASMLVRWPIAGTVPAEAPDDGRAVNDVSIVLDLHFGLRRILLTGDAEDDVDPQLLADGLAADRGVDALKVAHHGSRTATSAALLAALQPKVAIISVGAHNRYGHPAPETVARLAAVGATTYRTDRDGTVEVSTDGHDLRVSAEHGQPTAAPSDPPALSGASTIGLGTTAAGASIVRAVSPYPRSALAGPRASLESGRGHPLPARGGDAPPGLLAAAVAPCPRRRRGRRGGLPRRPRRGPRPAGRSPPRRGGGPPPRRGQAAPQA